MIFRSSFLVIRNVLDFVLENMTIQILRSIITFRKSRCLSDYVENYGTARQAVHDNKIQRVHIACWVTKASNTNSEYEMVINFPPQQWLSESTAVLLLHVAMLPVLFLNTTSWRWIHSILKRRKECLVSADIKWCDIKPAIVSMEFKHLCLNKQYYCARGSAEGMCQVLLRMERETTRKSNSHTTGSSYVQPRTYDSFIGSL